MNDPPADLRELVQMWTRQADQDYRALVRLAPDDTPDVACFLAQQCAEKYLKALIAASGADPSRTHDLGELRGELPDAAVVGGEVAAALRFLHPFAVVVRYPGADANAEDATRAVACARTVRTWARELLGLDNDGDEEEPDDNDDT